MDSYTDLSSDRKNGNTALRWTALGKMAVVLSGVRRLPNIIVRQPGLLPAIVGKMRAANANKDDSRNAERTQE
jgi:hypothetical protein